MITVVVNSGACGYAVTISAEKNANGKISISLETDCDMVKKMQADIAQLDKTAAFVRFESNPVYRSASKHLKHAACSVPSGILKALEVAADLNVPKDVTIAFVKKEQDR